MQTNNQNLKENWALDPDVIFLNHGSFGACPKSVLRYQQELRARIEHQPVQFYVRDFEWMLDEARVSLATFLNVVPEDLAWVPNATTGVNAVLQSLRFEPGDELLVTDHEYNACRNVLDFVAARDQARVIVVQLPFPVTGPAMVVDTIMARVTARTRLALLDHVTSQTGLVMPLAEIVEALRARNILSLIDGAHAPGMLDADLTLLDADFYTGNCHKWICAPKGAGFLHVRKEWQAQIRPPVISHGANSKRKDRSRFLIEFDWPGTWDPTAVLSVPRALLEMEKMLPGGWASIRRYNHELATAARNLICSALGATPPCPDDMLGSLASVPLPDASGPAPLSALYGDPLQDILLKHWSIEVPIVPWPAHPQRLIRVSAQLYNRESDYQCLSSALEELFPQ